MMTFRERRLGGALIVSLCNTTTLLIISPAQRAQCQPQCRASRISPGR